MGSVIALIRQLDAAAEVERKLAAGELARLGAAVVPTLVEALGHGSAQVRGGAALALGKIGPDAASAVPALIDRMGDTAGSVRQRATEALASIGALALDPLVAALGNPDALIQGGAAIALGDLGEAARKAIDALEELIEHGDPFVWRHAASAIGKMLTSQPSVLLDCLREAWGLADQRMAEAMLIALRETKAATPQVGRLLVSAYVNRAGTIREAARITFRTLFPNSSIDGGTLQIPGAVAAEMILSAPPLPPWGSEAGDE